MSKADYNYKKLVNTVDGIVWEADATTFQFSFVSKSAERMLGYPVQQWIDEPTFWQDHIHPEDREKAISYCRQCTFQKESHEFDYRMIASDGSIVYLYDNVSVIVENDEPVLLRGIMIDISERKKDERAVLKHEQELNLIYNKSVTATFLLSCVDDTYRFASVNQAFLISTGLHKRDVVGKNIEEVVPASSLPVISNKCQEAIDKGSTVQWEEVSEYPAGTKTGIISITPVFDKHGHCKMLVGTVHDITERKNAEQPLLLSEQRFKSLVQNSKDLLAIIDTQGVYRYVSPTSTKLLGIDPEYFIGKNAFKFIHEDDVERTRQALASIGNTKQVDVPPFRFKNGDGEWRWIESTVTNLLDDPAVNGIVVNSRDITEKKIAEELIEQSEKRFRLLVKAGHDLITLTKENGSVLYVRPSVESMLGYSIEEFKNLNLFDLIHPDDIEKVKQEFLGIQTERIVKISPYRYKHKNGLWRWLETILNDLRNEPGLNAIVVNSRDITRRIIAEEEAAILKRVKQKEITDAVFAAQERERSQIGMELHDNVNQLLGAIRLYIDMARKDEVNRDALLKTSANYALTAIEEIRKLSKTLITPSIQEIGLVDSIKELTNEIMLVHPIQITITAPDFIEGELSDKFKLNIFRIIQEQINNILKHAQAQKITIDIKECHDNLLFLIADNGIGFDVSDRKAGVGLSNIKSRSEIYRGDMKLQSEHGKGTTLSIAFSKADLVAE